MDYIQHVVGVVQPWEELCGGSTALGRCCTMYNSGRNCVGVLQYLVGIVQCTTLGGTVWGPVGKLYEYVVNQEFGK